MPVSEELSSDAAAVGSILFDAAADILNVMEPLPSTTTEIDLPTLIHELHLDEFAENVTRLAPPKDLLEDYGIPEWALISVIGLLVVICLFMIQFKRCVKRAKRQRGINSIAFRTVEVDGDEVIQSSQPTIWHFTQPSLLFQVAPFLEDIQIADDQPAQLIV